MHELSHDLTSRKVSPWGGIKFFQQTYARSGIQQVLRSVLPKPGSNAGYDPVDVAEGFMVSAVLGAKRLSHSVELLHLSGHKVKTKL